MKKSFILSLLLALCCCLQCWAEFNPTLGKMYALKEKTTGLYLDIQTLGIHESGHTTNSMSLNANPCVIYFESGDGGKWRLKNINGTYGSNSTSNRNWNTTISETPYDWIFAEETEGLTISKSSNNYIGWDKNKTIVAGSALYNNAEGGNGNAARIYFALVEYSYAALNLQGYYTLNLQEGDTKFYMNFTKSGDTEASLQATPTYLYVLPSANNKYLMFQDKSNTANYLGHPDGGWSTTFDCKVWEISDADDEGLVTISRHVGVGANGGKTFGTDSELKSGLGLYTNVGTAKKWVFEGVFDYPTLGKENNGNYEFTSDKIYYYNPCNTLRFTLTESGAFFENGSKRMSLDEFYLYDAQGNEVELTASNVSGNNNKTYEGMFDRTDGTFAGTKTWSDGTEDDYFEILLPKDVNLGGAFSFKFVTENTTMNAKAFKIETLYQKNTAIVYSFALNAPQDETPTVTYNGETVAADQTFEEGEFDIELFNATEIPGYTWSVEVDDENATITILYSEASIDENPEAVVALAKRIGGEGAADKFKFVLDPSLNSKQEVFVLDAEGEKILIKGTTISAITTGLGWYLNHIAKINIAWNSLNEKTVSGAAYADLSDLPLPATVERHVSDAKYRYYLNTCTFGYSMTSWTWKRWQQEIDWMALHGINMPLQLVGMEEVWRKFLTLEDANGNRKYGYTDEAAKAFVAGPAFIAWWAMNNLEGWGGTAPGTKSGGTWEGAGGVQDDAWYVRQKNLSNSIVTRQRELGMQPVLPGWSGMVPTNFAAKSGYATRGNGGNWAGDFVRPLLLNVSNANYAEIAADYYACLKDVMGESQYYSMDPFHEGGGAGTAEDYQALYAAMEAAKPGSQWVIQQWQWSPTQKLSLTNVPEGRLIVLDLFSDGSPAFDGYSGYAPQEAVFCAIPNFGGRSGLMGRLNNLTDNYFKFKAKYASIMGIGAAPEAIEQTPVTYDLIFQLPWMNGVKPNVQEWVANYAVARYGQDNEEVKAAWDLLRQGPLNYGADGIQGPVEDVWAARPNLIAKEASAWGATISRNWNGTIVAGNTYTKERRQMLIDATYKLLNQQDELNLTVGSVYESNYNYDLVEFGGGVMADYAHDLLLGINTAKNAEGTNGETYKARRDAFLALIADVDKFKGTNLNFRLGKWTQEARDAAKEVNGATSATSDWYEYNNARTIVSTWSSPNTNLNDYSYRSWQGLMKDLYLPRWKHYFNNNCSSAQYGFFEWNWAHGMTHAVGQTAVSSTPLAKGEVGHTDSYTREPEGNTVTEAWNLLNKYIVPITVCGKSTYAYRHLENDFTSSVTIGVQAGTVDLAQLFGVNLENATLTIEGITNNVTNLKEVNIFGAEGTYPATLTLGDKTVIKFTIRINSARDQAQQELQELIADMTALINNCGEVTIEQSRQETAYVLQYENASNANYLSSNADQNVVGNGRDGKGISGLTDNDVTTYMHTQWSGTAVGETHYVQVSNIQDLEKFTFTYATRKAENANNTSPAPTIIELYGSTDGENYTELIATFKNADTENPLPSYKDLGKYWTSVDLNPTTQYKGLRFKVTESQGPGGTKYEGQFFFAMSEFALTGVITNYIVNAIVGDNAGIVTVEQLTAAAKANEFAKELAYSLIPQTEADLQAKKTELQAIYDALYKAYKTLPSIYTINYIGNEGKKALFVAYNEAKVNTWDTEGLKGYKLLGEGSGISNSEADKYFTMVPKEGGFTLSVQGLYLNAPEISAWKHVLLSDKQNEAGIYLFEEVQDEVFKIRSILEGGNNVNYLNMYASDTQLIMGNDVSTEESLSTFTFTKVDTYPVTISDASMATLCLPFNVVMPEGMKAYDFATSDITTTEETGVYDCSMHVVAASGETLKSGTPVILHATPGDYALPIQYDANVEAKTSLQSSLLRGNFIAQELEQSAENIKFIFTKGGSGVGFYRMQDAGGTIAGNKCWMEWNVQTMPTNVKALRISFDQTTGIDNVPTTEQAEAPAIYDLAGRKLTTLQRGFNIVNGKKVIIK